MNDREIEMNKKDLEAYLLGDDNMARSYVG